MSIVPPLSSSSHLSMSADIAQIPSRTTTMSLPDVFSNEAGRNRSRAGHQQIAAQTDLEAVQLWLAEFVQSPHTLRSYRKEVVRLMLWAKHYLNRPLSDLTREDLLAYEAFLHHPGAEWCDPLLPRHGSERRLFTRPLSTASIRQAMCILSGMFSYLVEAGFLVGNPLALRRRSAALRKTGVERYLDQPLWHYLLEFIDDLPKNSLREQRYYERMRWVFRLFYALALRVSEAAQATAGDFVLRRGQWWLRVKGKGGIEAEVPVSAQLMQDFGRYRQFHGLPAYPEVGDRHPLILSITGSADHPLTSTNLYLMVKKCFAAAGAQLAAQQPHAAATLMQASTHWLRHTSATHQADAGNDLRHIQQNLRHASIETTSIYLHVEQDKRHQATVDSINIKPRSETVTLPV